MDETTYTIVVVPCNERTGIQTGPARDVLGFDPMTLRESQTVLPKLMRVRSRRCLIVPLDAQGQPIVPNYD